MSSVDFDGSVKYLYSLGNEVEAMKLGLDNIRRLLAALGDPHENYLKVQVAGTNGKGSVCAFLNSICYEAGIKTGLFTSPHLVAITERVRIDGVDISETDFARHATRLRETAERLVASRELEYTPTFFEQVTAIALVAFAEARVELAILETGLGGRLDATTAANAEIAAITRIDYDHQEYLGDTIAEIAVEKAAIIRADSKVVALHQSRDAEQAILGRCREVGVDPVWATTDIDAHAIEILGQHVFTFRSAKRNYPRIESWGMLGKHQGENASVAISIAETLEDDGLPINELDISLGLEKTVHPGRLEYIDNFLFDGAHNVGGATALREFLDEFETRPITLVFGAMRGKDVGEIMEKLLPRAKKFVLTQPNSERALSVTELEQFVPKSFDREQLISTQNVADALAKADEVAGDDGIILVTGSLYLVGEAKKILNN